MAAFSMYAGDTRNLRISVKDSNGAAVDLTGATIRFQAARSVRGSPIISKAISAGITVESPPTGGIFNVRLLSADTLSLGGSKLYFEAEVKSGLDVLTVIDGEMDIKPALIKD